MYYTTLHFRGYAIIVENYIYKLRLDPSRHFITMQDVIGYINQIEDGNDILSKTIREANEKKAASDF
jgi:hypothetical protein